LFVATQKVPDIMLAFIIHEGEHAGRPLDFRSFQQ
jgi:hypothetical protein